MAFWQKIIIYGTAGDAIPAWIEKRENDPKPSGIFMFGKDEQYEKLHWMTVRNDAGKTFTINLDNVLTIEWTKEMKSVA